MEIKFATRWYAGTGVDSELDPRLFALLQAVREHGSLKQAALSCAVSYRFAWELMRKCALRFGRPAVVLEQGRGAKLSELGEKLLWAEQLLHSRLQPELNLLHEEINHELNLILQPAAASKKLRLHASHDLAIAHLEELCQVSGKIELDLQFRGSLESLRDLAAGQCDMAGFHFPRGELAVALQRQYRNWLDSDRLKLVQLATRQQGLMLGAGNPRRIRGLDDLVKRSIRFINRQKESGTRIIFDQLLQHANIDRSRIKGYHDEEFTHLAVAAMLASGAADVAFGIKAAAVKFGLDFIPLVEESYVLAAHKQISERIFAEIKHLLRSDSFSRKIKTLPGYLAQHTGKAVSIEKLLSGK